MSLREAVEERQHSRQPTKCPIALLLRTIPEADELQAILTDPQYLGTVIAAALNDRGHEVSPTAVQRHRRGDCRCG